MKSSLLLRRHLKCEISDPFSYLGFGHVGENLTLDELKSKMSCLQVDSCNMYNVAKLNLKLILYRSKYKLTPLSKF